MSTSAADGLRALRARVTAAPDDPFWWSRLGNACERAGRIDEARTAWTRAVVLDPADVESHHSLGALLADAERWTEAIPHFQAVIEHAHRWGGRVDRELLRSIVRDAHEHLLVYSDETGASITLVPERPLERGASAPGGQPLLHVMDLDLDDDDDRERLVDLVLGEPPRPRRRTNRPRRHRPW